MTDFPELNRWLANARTARVIPFGWDTHADRQRAERDILRSHFAHVSMALDTRWRNPQAPAYLRGTR